MRYERLQSNEGALRSVVTRRNLSLVVIVCAVFATGAIVLKNKRQSHELDELLQSIHESGEPTTPKAWNDHYAARNAVDERNCFSVCNSVDILEERLEQAFIRLDDIVDSRDELPAINEPWIPFETYEKFLENNQQEMSAIRRGANSGELTFYPHYFGPDVMRDSYVWQLSAAADLLVLEALVRIHQGDSHESLEAVLSILHAADAMDGNPQAPLFWMRSGIERMFYRAAALLIQDENLSTQDLLQLQAEIRSINHRENLKWAIIGERISGLLGRRTAGIDLPVKFNYPATTSSKLLWVQSTTSMISALGNPWHLSLRVAQDIQANLNSAMSRQALPWKQSRLAGLFTSAAEGVAMARSVDVIIAIELFRRQRGGFPPTLAELTPNFIAEVPLDPFDGMPIRYLTSTTEITEIAVYSIAQNLSDDGGKLAYSKQLDDRPDLGFKLKRAPGVNQTVSPAQ